MTENILSVIANIGRVIRMMLGAPDYERYIAHVRNAHPGCTPVTRAQFEQERLSARYMRPGSRCC